MRARACAAYLRLWDEMTAVLYARACVRALQNHFCFSRKANKVNKGNNEHKKITTTQPIQ